jgi:hypothetical protein
LIRCPQNQATHGYRKTGVDIHPQRLAADVSYPFRFLMRVAGKADGVLYHQDSFVCLNHAPCRLLPGRTELPALRSQGQALPGQKRAKVCHCRECGNSFPPFSGTIFEKSGTDMRKWFYAAHLILNDKAVKDNQKNLHKDIREYFEGLQAGDIRELPEDVWETGEERRHRSLGVVLREDEGEETNEQSEETVYRRHES